MTSINPSTWLSNIDSARRSERSDAALTSRTARQDVDVGSLSKATRDVAQRYADAIIFDGPSAQQISNFVSFEISQWGRDGVQKNLNNLMALYGAVLSQGEMRDINSGVVDAGWSQGVTLSVPRPDYVFDLRGFEALQGVFNGTKLLRQGNESYDRATELVQLGLQTLSAVRDGELALHGADGRFGPETGREIRQFQQQQGLTADGIVGRNTINALANALNAFFRG